MQSKQIFQQPHAGDAMNRWNSKCHAAECAVSEINQSLLQCRVVEESPLLALRRFGGAHAGVAAQIVKVLQPVFGEQIVDDQATLAAKNPFADRERGIDAGVSTMKAACVFTRRAARSRGVNGRAARRVSAGYFIQKFAHSKILK